MHDKFEELAKMLGVSVVDVKCLAHSVANSIKQDKASSAILSLNTADAIDVVLAYVPAAVRKFQQFQSTYLVNQVACENFKKSILLNLESTK